MARRAEAMTNVLAPRGPAGSSPRSTRPRTRTSCWWPTPVWTTYWTVADLWRELPMDKQIIMRWWQVPRSEIPEGREARIDWLFGWWEEIDTWIEQNRPKDLSSGRHR